MTAHAPRLPITTKHNHHTARLVWSLLAVAVIAIATTVIFMLTSTSKGTGAVQAPPPPPNHSLSNGRVHCLPTLVVHKC
jgi:hypothetical protein